MRLERWQGDARKGDDRAAKIFSFGAGNMRLTIALAWLLVFGANLAAGQASPPSAACDAAEHRQFDFWVGSWTVTSGGKPAGTNEITREERGCVLHERWTGAGGNTGQSFNFYDRSAKQWRQVWIDSAGNPLDLWGGMADGKMILTGKTRSPNGASLQRITWSREPDGAVRQLWESSTDDGKTWSVAFDGLYRRSSR